MLALHLDAQGRQWTYFASGGFPRFSASFTASFVAKLSRAPRLRGGAPPARALQLFSQQERLIANLTQLTTMSLGFEVAPSAVLLAPSDQGIRISTPPPPFSHP